MRRSLTALAAAALLALPAAAVAQQTIDDGALRRQNDACIARCSETRSYAACAEVCGWMAGEMRRHWTAEQYLEREGRFGADPADAEIGREMGLIANHCARRGRMR